MECERPTKKLLRSRSGLRIVASDDNFISPFELQEPHWTPDKEISHCTNCSIKFGLTTRRHHCRRCGLIFCSECCNSKLELLRMCFIDPVRICHHCVPVTLEENKFFESHLKTLINGAVFAMQQDGSILGHTDVHCKLSLDHRCLLFNGVEMAPLELSSVRDLHSCVDADTGISHVELAYTFEDSKDMARLKLSLTPEMQHHKGAASWIEALQQAFKLLSEFLENR